MNLPGYDQWKTGLSRSERDQERKDSAYAEALSERDSELREDSAVLAEVFIEAIHFNPEHDRLKAILQAAACHKPPREIGEALTRLVQDIITADARRHAEEETR